MTQFLFLLLLMPPGATVPAGTRVNARLQSIVHTRTSREGDAVTAVLTGPIRSAGQIVVPEGTYLNGRVETVQAATKSNEGRVRLVFRELEFPDGRRLSTWITDAYGAKPPRRHLRYLIYTGVGGTGGGLIGGKNARVAGILGGVLIGFIIAGNSGDSGSDVTLHRGRALHLELGADLIIESF
jgi:hypothetical protein